MNTTVNEPTVGRVPSLAKPGSGLPGFETWVLRHLGFPLLARSLGQEAARKLFVREGHRIHYLAQDLTDYELAEPVLVKRLMGAEDNSRYWSMEMLMEHLILMGVSVQDSVRQLSKGVRPMKPFRSSDLQPKGGRGPRIRDEFSRFLDRFAKVYENRNLPSRPTHRHAWFGELGAAHWLKFAAIQTNLARTHAERIAQGL